MNGAIIFIPIFVPVDDVEFIDEFAHHIADSAREGLEMEANFQEVDLDNEAAPKILEPTYVILP